MVKEKDRVAVGLEAKIDNLKQEKDAEINEKKELLLKIKLLDSNINKVNELEYDYGKHCKNQANRCLTYNNNKYWLTCLFLKLFN